MTIRDSIALRYSYNDLTRNKGVNLALIVILVFSAFLMATGSMVIERVLSSMDQFFDEARPPHFLQMHKGAYDRAELERFASEHPEIDAWLIEEMLGYDSAAIAWERSSTGEGGDLADSLIDNLFVTQNAEFDFLLDENGSIPRPDAGEVYVPVAYREQFGIEVGDLLRVQTAEGVQELRVEGFVRDSQMASSLSQSTRFLISEDDFAAMSAAGGAIPEIIVEYRLTDTSLVQDFQTAYESDDALPKNGESVPYQLLRIVNALSDGLVAAALMFASLLLVAIALLNARFVIRGTLEDEVRQIGAMKAIGLPNRTISGLYLAKYRAMTFLACVVGGLLAIAAAQMLTRTVQVDYGAAEVDLVSVLVPVLALAFVYVFVIAICRRVFGKIRRIEVVNALVHGSTLDDRQTARRAAREVKRVRRTSLAAFGGGNLNRRLALLDLRAEARQWVLIPIVMFLAAVLMTLPMNLLSTLSDPAFVTFMGSPESDLRADLEFSEDVDAVHGDLLAAMSADEGLENVRAFANVLYETEGEEGWEVLRVDVGDFSSAAMPFIEGGPPGTGEIALSVMNAEKYGLATGDEILVRLDGEPSNLTVSGVYQDITGGGLSAKMQGEVDAGAASYTVFADTAAGADTAELVAEYADAFPSAKVTPMREFMEQTLSYVTDAVRNAALLTFAFGLGVALVITSLFLKLRLTRDRQKMGMLSAVGFSTNELIAQVRGKTLAAVVVGTVLGSVFAATGGESVAGSLLALAGLGIVDLEFLPNPWLVYLAYPLLLISAGYLGAVFLTSRLRGADKSSWLRG
ncbi:ABC transporter permease [Glycomyces albidus]|uniref:FtsX-like permease family protein n=1 Tax=Glycomyces albidus TaxID=2656774 RepID=A0A6L5G510_9ACTN|nr:ABC transporter permease [Glycomyces albidus]MQM24711.1 FtsX-like permease family protein [Glycomyces albidus]